MRPPITILHTADSHIGAAMPTRPRVDKPRRGTDLIESFERVMRMAVEREADLVLHCGDLFDKPDPSAAAIAAAADPILRVAATGVPVVIVPGNHERSALPATLLLSHRNIHIVSKPQTLVLPIRQYLLAVAAWPCVRRSITAQFSTLLEQTGWDRVAADHRILALHQTFDSAVCGPAGFRFRSGDDVVPLEMLPEGFDYVAAGHIHRHQVIASPTGADVVYAGSCDRISFAEVDEPKGAVIVRLGADGVRHSLIEHDVRPMSVWPVDISGLSRQAVLDRIADVVCELPPRALARIDLSGVADRAVLHGLGASDFVRHLREDAMISVKMHEVEAVSARAAARRSSMASHPFAHLPGCNSIEAPATACTGLPADGATVDVPVNRWQSLPGVRGVYALLDDDDRLLYIGKSCNLRSRVRSHLRDPLRSNRFRGWSRQAARVAVRPTSGELEALLLEFELIRLFLPAYNRQHRRWKRYCYVCADHDMRTLRVERTVPRDVTAFGPFRSVRLARNLIDAIESMFGPRRLRCPCPCSQIADLADDRDSQQPGRLIRDILQGTPDQSIVEAFAAIDAESNEGAERAGEHGDTCNRFRAVQQALRQTTENAAARALYRAMVVLPGCAGSRPVALMTPGCVGFDVLRRSEADAKRLLRRHQKVAAGDVQPAIEATPKAIADALLIAHRYIATNPGCHVIVNAAECRTIDASRLLDRAFGLRNAPGVDQGSSSSSMSSRSSRKSSSPGPNVSIQGSTPA